MPQSTIFKRRLVRMVSVARALEICGIKEVGVIAIMCGNINFGPDDVIHVRARISSFAQNCNLA